MVLCPSCGIALPKEPTRKSKCPSCGEWIFVKSTPDDRAKRLMTAAQADEAEKMWARRTAELDYLMAGEEFGISPGDLAGALRSHGEHVAALRSLLQSRAVGGDEKALDKMLRLSDTVDELKTWMLQDLLIKLQQLAQAGYRRDQITLEVNIADEIKPGERPAVCGPQCAERVGRYPIGEGLERMPLPCALQCACRYMLVVDTSNSAPAGIAGDSDSSQRPDGGAARRSLKDIMGGWLRGARE